jgi:hypothetical protein
MTTTHDPGRGLTKAQLRAQLAACRRELAERELVGMKLAHLAGIAARPGIRLDADARRRFGTLAREWDAIERAKEGGGD